MNDCDATCATKLGAAKEADKIISVTPTALYQCPAVTFKPNYLLYIDYLAVNKFEFSLVISFSPLDPEQLSYVLTGATVLTLLFIYFLAGL